ncbi:uncharacterized protein BKA78DRAFT_299760 [Phyllosticta capitalensis]|uniref:uncharacterized protein n=1 Tax=Phyllosticta capitalensis TaxID=121624 RepID=UPI00312F0B0A
MSSSKHPGGLPPSGPPQTMPPPAQPPQTQTAATQETDNELYLIPSTPHRRRRRADTAREEAGWFPTQQTPHDPEEYKRRKCYVWDRPDPLAMNWHPVARSDDPPRSPELEPFDSEDEREQTQRSVELGNPETLGWGQREPSAGEPDDGPHVGGADDDTRGPDDGPRDDAIDPAEDAVSEPENNDYDEPNYGAYGGPIHEPERKWGNEHLTTLFGIEFRASSFDGPTRRYLTDFSDSLRKLVQRVWDESEDRGIQGEWQYKSFMKHGVATLASMSTETTVAIIEGILPRVAVEENTHFPQARLYLNLYQQELNDMKESLQKGGRFQPCIYAQYLCDEQGNGPTLRDMWFILNALHSYGKRSSPKLVDLVDNAHNPPPTTRTRSDQRDQNSRGTLRQRAEVPRAAECLKSTPLSRLFKRVTQNVVWSAKSKSTRGAYGHHETLGRVWIHQQSLPALQGTPGPHQIKLPHEPHRGHLHPVHAHLSLKDPTEVEQGWVGKILLNRIGLGYTNTGYGMSYHPTGRNNSSATTFAVGHYLKWAAQARTITPFKNAIHLELENQKRRASTLKDQTEKMREEAHDVDVKTGKLFEKIGSDADKIADKVAPTTQAMKDIKKMIADALATKYIEEDPSIDDSDDDGGIDDENIE